MDMNDKVRLRYTARHVSSSALSIIIRHSYLSIYKVSCEDDICHVLILNVIFPFLFAILGTNLIY